MSDDSTKKNKYDVLVIGLGGHGSAILYHLAKRGRKVLGLERFAIPHDKGSSHGESRIIRLAYHEHPDYVPLLRRAWQLWKQLEEETGEVLLCDTKCIETSCPDFNGGDNCFQHSLLSAKQHDLEHEILSGDEVNSRFPGYQLPAHYKREVKERGEAKKIALRQAVLGPGGILASERCISAHTRQAERAGARVCSGEAVLHWEVAEPSGEVVVATDKGCYRAKKVVLAAGAWMPHLVPELQSILTVERQVLGWFEVLHERCFQSSSFPVCIIENEIGAFYNFPTFEEPGMKIGKYHHLKERVDHPEALSRTVTSRDEEVLREGVAEWFPAANGRMLKAATCMFTNSSDGHFLLDTHPRHPQVLLCSACSGHGYKFCSVVGEIMAQLALDGEAQLDIGLHKLCPGRPGHAEVLDSFSTRKSNYRARF